MFMWVVFSKLGPLWGVLFIRVPYYVWDLKRDPTLENYGHVEGPTGCRG